MDKAATIGILKQDEFSSAVDDTIQGCFGVVVKSFATVTAVFSLALFAFKLSKGLGQNP